MKATFRSFERNIGLMVLALALLICVPPAGAQSSPHLSKKELKALLVSAKTPQDQERLAAYYRDKAARLKAKSEEFSSHADDIAGEPATIESKQGISCNCVSHFRYFSQRYLQEAKDAQALAAQHERLAQTSLPNP